jgi:murein DD-endopeptidase MepM/ murein hydrolase activator NlpD
VSPTRARPAVQARSTRGKAKLGAGLATLATGALVAVVPAAPAGAAGAGASEGGVVFYETPQIKRVACVKRCASRRRAQGGSVVRIAGRSLTGVSKAVFHGSAGDQDDVEAPARPRGETRLLVRVPRKAVSGPISVETEDAVGSEPTPPVDILPPLPSDLLARRAHVFPIPGRHAYGGAGARFGTGRAGHSHQGQDVFAKCGTPLVAARGGRVQFRGYHAAAGHYLVIDGARTRTDYVYMHLVSRSPFRRGDPVATGQRIGEVGDSGNARGCHLHFELWTGPGWYQGGRPIDPLRPLRTWDRWS